MLACPTPGRGDNFFELGGNSLHALRVLSRVREKFQVGIPLRVLFDSATLAQLASEISAQLAVAADHELQELVRSRQQGPVPLSYSQERMWLIQAMNPATSAYNMAAALWLRGELDVTALSRSVDELLRRHEILRTRIQTHEGAPVQVVDPWRRDTLHCVDMRGAAHARDAAVELVTAGANAVYDLERDPACRAWLVRTADDTHLLAFGMHHVAGDQWSLGILGRELALLYAHGANADAAGLAPLPVSYADFSRWQRGPDFTRHYNHQLEFWRTRLAGLPALAMPTDHPRPALWTMNGATLERQLPADLLRRLEQLARDSDCTGFMVLFAAFTSLLSRVAGQCDIAVGVPVANRSHHSTENIVGTFVNTIVLRTDLAGNPSFRELLGRIRDTTLDAFANQDVPFDRLVQEIGQRGDRSRPPLAQVMFNVANAPMRGIELPGIEARDQLLQRGGSQFEFSFSIDTERTERLFVQYNTDLFEPESMERLADQYVQLLESAIGLPQTRIGDLVLLPPEQRAALKRFNETDRPDWRALTVPRLFCEQVRRAPQRVAVCCGEQSLTYRELDERSESLARQLHAAGAAPGVVVAVCLQRSVELLVALLAVQKSGAAYLPLDRDFPAARLNFMLADSSAAILVTAGALPSGVVPPAGTSLLDIAEHSGVDERSASGTEPAPDDTAYVIYTSGSTGLPKGVVVTHASLANLLCSMRERPGMRESDVLAAVTTISFDIAGLELYLPLIVGARIELVTGQQSGNGEALAQMLDRRGVTVMQATPATWRILVESGWRGNRTFRAWCGGEALSRCLADDILERAGELWNLYGPTETTIWSTVARIDRDRTPISIGEPLANTTVHVVDDAGGLCPVGVAGEICIGGVGVARGYLARDALTAERFVADPFAQAAGLRMYRTGDRGYRASDGRLYCLGRADQQVKVRGFRIELGEIEQALGEHPAVLHAVVTVHEARADDRRIVAYVVFRDGEQATASDIKRFLQDRLPRHCIPALVMFLQTLPMTPNAKVDRNALPDPFCAQDTGPGDSDPPMSETEGWLAGVWREVLRVPAVAPRDNFFDLGGHSLLALRVARLVESAGVGSWIRACCSSTTCAA